MASTTPGPPGPLADPSPTRGARQLVLLSALFLVVQVAATDYGDSDSGTAVAWFVVGAVVLWFVYGRRSRTARRLAVLAALLGAVVYAFAAVTDGGHAAVVALAYVGQALPLLAGPVRRHVQVGPVVRTAG